MLTVEEQVSKPPANAGVNLHVGNSEDLKGYEEAILSRKAPVLKLPTKVKGRDPAPTTTKSHVLPPVSQMNRPIGGGVASLSFQGQHMLPTAAGASSVPPGTTPNPGLQQFQQQNWTSLGDPRQRPMLTIPKTRSRPSTAIGHYPTSGMQSANSSGPPSAIYPPQSATSEVEHGSSSGSRPGTASSRGDPVPVNGAASASSPNHSSPFLSRPNSRPTTASGPSNQILAYVPEQFEGPSYHSNDPASRKLALHHVASAENVLGARPSYKRLASQVLEPSNSKRPHYRRGDTNFKPTPDGEEDDEFDSASDVEPYANRRIVGSAGYHNSDGFGIDYSRSIRDNSVAHGNSMRRMSEPSGAPPRMMVTLSMPQSPYPAVYPNHLTPLNHAYDPT